MTTGQLVTSQLVCDVTINRPRTTSATANLGFHSQSSFIHVICKWWYAVEWMIIRKYVQMMPWSRRNYTFVNLQATEISKRCVWSRGPDGYRKNDRKRAVVWPWLVLELCTVLALTQLGIRQSDWWRARIRSTNLHIVVEYVVRNNVLTWIALKPSCYFGSGCTTTPSQGLCTVNR